MLSLSKFPAPARNHLERRLISEPICKEAQSDHGSRHHAGADSDLCHGGHSISTNLHCVFIGNGCDLPTLLVCHLERVCIYLTDVAFHLGLIPESYPHSRPLACAALLYFALDLCDLFTF